MTKSSRAIFLSYASQDAEAAGRICDALRAAGIEVWFDRSELRGGDAWDRQIRKHIQDCALFIPIISKATQGRLEGYFRREWRLAVDRTHDMADTKPFLVPVVIDATCDQDAAVPDAFKAVQWTHLPAGETPSAFLARVARLLTAESPAAPAEVTSPTAAAARDTGGAPRPPAPIASRQSPRVLLLIAAVVVIGVGYVAVDRLSLVTRAARGQPSTQLPLSQSEAAASKEAASRAIASPSSAAQFAPPPHSIAVLPFVNMSGDKEQDYFSDGLSEELLNSLARINELQVAARTSSFYFKGEHVDLSTVAHKLNVASILEGSVRRSGNTIRITAQLNNAVTGFHLWSQTYDRNLGDVLKLQTEIANAVANTLKVTLLGDLAAKIEVGGTQSPAAFDAYLRGLRLSRNANDESNAHAAIEAYGEAIRLDPLYALAFAGRSIAYSNYIKYFVGKVGHEDLPGKARADAERAIALAPELAEGHVALSNVLEWHFLQFAPAVEQCDRALALAPGSALVVRWCSGVAADMGRFDAAIAAARRGVAFDPLNPLTHLWLADALQKARRFEESIPIYRETLELDPRYLAAVYGQQGLSYYLLGDLQRAKTTCETPPQDWQSWVCLAMTYHKLRQRGEAAAQIPKLAQVPARNGGSLVSLAYQLGQIDAQWGDKEKALAWLEKALRLRDSGLPNLKTDPLLDPLRAEPRFQVIERALKFPD